VSNLIYIYEYIVLITECVTIIERFNDIIYNLTDFIALLVFDFLLLVISSTSSTCSISKYCLG
jgi:hypothetical protein